MPFTRTVLVLSLGLFFLQSQAQAAPPLSLTNGNSELTAQISNAWIEIDKTALEHNIRTLQAELAGKSKLCAVLKADAYGHGIGLVMPSVIALGVPCVAVASNEEARVVRESGFKGQLIRVRTASLGELENALQYNIEELVGNLDFARQAADLAHRHGRKLQVHIGLNSSGMSRNGVEMATEQGKKDAVAITKVPNLEVVAIMTHFAVEIRTTYARAWQPSTNKRPG
jgi:alanine racemase